MVGTRLGAYEIIAPLGSGGMGEVYRARDTRLAREVALKVLPKAFAGDPDRLGRFHREAQVLASLNHPHIAQVYGFEEGDNNCALVMELVEGPTLADRVANGPIPLDDALSTAASIADALEAAHEQGIVHRDLKPANIKVRPDGTVKVLDFGLAKALEPAGSLSASATMSPTLSIHATQAGIILGTAAYMSPEQARGKSVDRRTDIWAFGCVVFEMLAGRRPFDGEDLSETLAGVLKSEPAWHALPADAPVPIRRLLRRCLEKDCKRRLQHIGDARLEIEDARQAGSVDTPSPSRRRGKQLVASSAAVILAIAATAVVAWRFTRLPDLPELRVDINTPATSYAPSFAISPDGRTLVFNADGPRGAQLWLRPLAETTARPLAGTEGGQHPFWSPDGRSIGFFADNKLKRLDLDGGRPQSLANVITPAGGAWGRDGTILYVPNDDGGVFRIAASGGESRQVVPGRSHAAATRLPVFLPDGHHFLFYVARGAEGPGVFSGDTEGGPPRHLIDADFGALYGFGHLLFVRDGTLFAQRFDAGSIVLAGPAMRVADNVAGALIGAAFSVSAAGPIAYRALSGTFGERRLAWFDRTGRDVGTVGERGAFGSNPSLSPDGRTVVLQRTVDNNIDIWAIDLERNVPTRVTFSPDIDSMPLWSPDGRRIVFNAVGSGGTWIVKHMDGSIPDERVEPASGPGVKIPCDWSPDGRLILFKQFDESTSTTDLWLAPMDGTGQPTPIARTEYNERDGQFSPDGKWIAYTSDESGQPEIYLQPFPGPGRKIRISTAGGEQVRWRRDGKELFYVARDTNLMSVPMSGVSGELRPGTPVPLFKTRIAVTRSISRQQYVVSPNGQKFLIMTAGEFPTTPITLILNWKPPAQP